MIVKYKHARDLRKKRVRAKVSGTAVAPRLCVFRSNKYIYGQLIDDVKGHTLVSVCGIKKENLKKIENSKKLGLTLAKLAQEKKIKNVVFDRNGYRYLGRVKAFAEGAREGGLNF